MMRCTVGLIWVLALGAWGCADDASGAFGEGGAGMAGAQAGVGPTPDTEDCPVWPAARLMPTVGPFFYGPDPGPCSYTLSGPSLSGVAYRYEAGKLASASIQHSGEEIAYARDPEGRVDVATLSNAEFTHRYEYGSDYVVDTTTDRDGALSQRERYSLSSTGYPLSSFVTEPNDVTYTRQYRYEDCRLISVVTVEPNGQLSPLLGYTYDGAGHVHQLLAAGDINYDYDCWR